MRTFCRVTYVLAAVSLALTSVRASAQHDEGVVQAMIPDARDVTRAALRTSQDGSDPDTVWIGHIYDPTYTAGGKMIAGGYGPYRVGRGPNRPKRAGSPVTIGDNGAWDFDRFQGARPGSPDGATSAEDDSLQGWWPVARPYQSGAVTFGDFTRAFFGLDYGNQVNYVINQGAPKRTFGVVGLWHRDRGNITYAVSDTVEDKDPIAPGTQDNITNVQPVQWSPTEVGGAGSTASAWMGLRSHGDLSHIDLVSNGGTGNPFNASLLQYQGNNGFNQIGSVSVNGTDHEFPGYGSQMDQMLYRDIVLGETDGLNISFNFSTNMSLSVQTAENTRIGWFSKDPISNAQSGVGTGATPTSDGNFVSAAVAGANAPCDSFMVYIGAPVNDNSVVFSAPLFVGLNQITTVYDPRRRWFSEVLRCNETTSGRPLYKELESRAGINAAGPRSINVGSLYAQALQDIKDANGAGGGGVVRLVFRVKTNRGFDDENSGNPAAAFSSGTRGAAIVDNVVVNGWADAEGNFENETGVGAINNDTAVSPQNAWKSTGKPPSAYWHAHSVKPGDGLAFDDPCGGQDNPNRQCNLYGKIVTSGDHDAAEKDGGLFGTNTQDRQRWLVSPTINLSSTGNGPGFYNAMGIDDEVARTTFDYALFSSLYNAGFVNALTATGNFMSVGYQSYPARQPNGNICWGEVRHAASIFFYGSRGCFETFYALAPNSIGAKANSCIRTTNAQNRPDSLRAYIHRISRCYTFTALLEATCSPAVGTYFDNISLALIDAPAPPAISLPIWNLINDAFPANGDPALPGTAGFDTTAAQVRIGLNIAAQTGSVTRPSIGGDSVVIAAPGADTRVDMVFRIDPGPGNYMSIGNRASGVSQRPDGKPSGVVAAVSGDGSFFGQYMSSPGAFSKGVHGPGNFWNANVWNSARMDTIERNLFLTAVNASVVGVVPGNWAGMLHDGDPKFGTLGILKNICVMPIPGGAVNSTNMACDGTGWGVYGAGSGWDGVTTTREFTKIIPDGLLTPGSHVQYFFRKSTLSAPTDYGLAPDTNFILQPTEGSTDGHRWQQFSVLPDRWKDPAWASQYQHAPNHACMLYIDWCDRRGDERTWVGIADTIGLTAPARWGAHNGWHARGNQDATVDLRTVIGTADDFGVYTHGGQPGTVWDMFGVKGSETGTTTGSIGSRGSFNPPGLQAGRKNLNGPTGLMLRNYYSVIMALTGDLLAGNIGPYVDKGDNDVGLLQDFAFGVAGTPQPRRIWFQGRGFMEGQAFGRAGGPPSFVGTFFGAGLASGDYRNYAANSADIVDLIPNAPLHSTGATYSVLSSCAITNDVLTVVGNFGAAMAAKYTDTVTNPNPKIASVYAPSSLPGTQHPMVTVVDGWRISTLGTWQTLTSPGLHYYCHYVLSSLFATLNCFSAPIAVGENPNPALVNFLALRSENPLRDGAAKITFGITRKERVELKVYDVTGRLVKTLANREFAVGEHTVYWDGSNDEGRLVSRGVYFYQLRTPSFVSHKKLAVLKR